MASVVISGKTLVCGCYLVQEENSEGYLSYLIEPPEDDLCHRPAPPKRLHGLDKNSKQTLNRIISSME